LWAEFSTARSTKTSLPHDIMHLDFLPDHPKSSTGCIKINCDGWESTFRNIPATYPTQHKPIWQIDTLTSINNHHMDVLKDDGMDSSRDLIAFRWRLV
jgi:hypothetical protein